MIKGIIFDMDGVISDTQKFHAQAESMVFKKYGIDISPEEITRKYAGIKDIVTFAEIIKKYNLPVDKETLRKQKWEIMDVLLQGNVHSIPGVIEFIKKLSEEKFSHAVGSASSQDYVKNILIKLGLLEYFSVFASAFEVPQGKPAPDIFLLAAKRLALSPKECMVIEDAPSGVAAAKAAGMKCIAITTTHSKEELKNADKIIHSFNELPVEDIRNL